MADEAPTARERLVVPADALDAFGGIPDSARARERLTVVRAPELPGLEVWDVRASARLWTVYHTQFRFCACWAPRPPGEQRWRYRGSVHSMTHGSIMLLEPGELHATLQLPPSDFAVAGLDPAWVEAATRELLHGRPMRFNSGQLEDAEAETRILRAMRAFLDGAETLVVEELLLGFLTRALERAGEHRPGAAPPRHPRSVRRALEYIHSRYSSRLTLDEIAGAAELSKFHLHRTFREAVGQPLHRYLIDVRLGQAMNRLQAGESPRTVASVTGFSDQAHLTRVFQRRLGMTPGRYRLASAR
ncbi:MAG TPA: AraC family transcriptional regulator [Polyangiaceae bacterium]